jgi:hypothetical protein
MDRFISIAEWLAYSLLSVGFLTLIAFMCRHWITERITRSIQYSYDKKFEELRAANERELKRFSTTLDTQQNLVSGAFLEARRASNDRRLNAIQSLWDAMMQASFDALPVLAMTDEMVTTEMYQRFFAEPKVREAIPRFRKLGEQYAQLARLQDTEKARLLSGEYLYALCRGYRTFLGSIALYLADCNEKDEFKPWWQYDHALALLKAVLTAEEFDELTAMEIGRYTWVRRTLETKFLKAAEDIVDGRRAATDAFDQAKEIMIAVNLTGQQPPR